MANGDVGEDVFKESSILNYLLDSARKKLLNFAHKYFGGFWPDSIQFLQALRQLILITACFYH